MLVGLDAAIFEAKNFAAWWIWVAFGFSIVLPFGRAVFSDWKNRIFLSIFISPDGFPIFFVCWEVAIIKLQNFTDFWILSLFRPSIMLPVVLAVHYGWKLWRSRKTRPKNFPADKQLVPTGQSHIFKYLVECFFNAMCGVMWLASALVAVLSYFAMASQSSRSSWEFGLGLAVWGLASVFLNFLIVGVKQKMQWTAFVVIGAASVLIVTMLAANWSAIPVAVVRALGLGDIIVGAVVSEDGCAIFNKAARGQKVCKMDTEQKIGWVCPVILKSRIGAPLVFELQSFGENGSWPISPFELERKRRDSDVNHLRYQLIQVPKADVKSWPSIESLPRFKEGSTLQEKDSGSSNMDKKESQEKKLLTGTNYPLLASYLNKGYEVKNEKQQKWLETQCGAAAMKR